MKSGQPVSFCCARACTILSASTLTSVIGASGQYRSGSRVVTSLIRPFCASSSTLSFCQKQRNAPVSFSFAMVCRAQCREKKFVSPEKNGSPSGIGTFEVPSSPESADSVSVGANLVDANGSGALGANSSVVSVSAVDSLHQGGASPVVSSLGADSSGSIGANSGTTSRTSSTSACLPCSACAVSISPGVLSVSCFALDIYFSIVLSSVSEVKGLFKNPITFSVLI